LAVSKLIDYTIHPVEGISNSQKDGEESQGLSKFINIKLSRVFMPFGLITEKLLAWGAMKLG